MTVFADSSALVKRYSDEVHHEVVRSITEPIVVSALARVEVPAALWRKHRIGELEGDDVSVLIADFELDWRGDDEPPAYAATAVTATVLDEAALQVARHGLRAYDGVQLASAVIVNSVEPLSSFVAFDRELRAAAAREGFALLPAGLDTVTAQVPPENTTGRG